MNAARTWTRIVVGVTPDEHTLPAVRRAYELASPLGAGVRLVHALEIPTLWGGISEEERAERYPQYIGSARESILDLLSGADGVPGGRVEEDLQVIPGHPSQVLLKEGAAHDADLLVLGPHEKRGIIDFGSTARAVLSKTPIPVWTQAHPVEKVQRILAPIDFSESSDESVGCAVDLARRFGAKLAIFHCYPPPALAYTGDPGSPIPSYVVDQEREQSRETLERFVSEGSWDDLAVETVFRTGEVVTEILAEAREHDLLVLGTHGRTGLSRFLLGSIAYGTLRRSEKPVLVVPSERTSWLLEVAASA